MRKKRIPPTRDQEIVTLDWMNPILNDGKAEGRGNFLNKGQPLRFFSSSFHPHFTVFSSFNTHSLSEMSVEWVRQSIPPNPLCRGGWGEWIDALIPYSSYSFNTHSVSRMRIECVRQSNPPNPLCRGGWGEWIPYIYLYIQYHSILIHYLKWL